MHSIKWQNTSIIYHDIHYDKFVKKVDQYFGNNASNHYTYDNMQRLSNIRSYTSEGELMQDIYYGYYAVGNIVRADNTANPNFPYDKFYTQAIRTMQIVGKSPEQMLLKELKGNYTPNDDTQTEKSVYIIPEIRQKE